MFIECSSFERGKTAEHELFIGLHARLIERVHALHIAGNAAGELKEAYELGKAGLGVSLRDAVCGWKCAVEKRSGFRYNQINESA